MKKKEIVLLFMYSTRCSCPIVMKLEFSLNIFEEKVLKYQNLWKSFQWEPS